jgi:hypothetical protein
MTHPEVNHEYRIPLSRDVYAVVDEDNYESLMQWKWYAADSGMGGFYAARSITKNRKNVTVLMHRYILGLSQDDMRVADHINHDTLDNKKIQPEDMHRITKCH